MAKPRLPVYWGTTLGRWLGAFGVSRLRQQLTQRGLPINVRTPYHWLDGSNAPSLPYARAMTQMSLGALSLEDIFNHREELARKRAAMPPTDVSRAGAAVGAKPR